MIMDKKDIWLKFTKYKVAEFVSKKVHKILEKKSNPICFFYHAHTIPLLLSNIIYQFCHFL